MTTTPTSSYPPWTEPSETPTQRRQPRPPSVGSMTPTPRVRGTLVAVQSGDQVGHCITEGREAGRAAGLVDDVAAQDVEADDDDRDEDRGQDCGMERFHEVAPSMGSGGGSFELPATPGREVKGVSTLSPHAEPRFAGSVDLLCLHDPRYMPGASPIRSCALAKFCAVSDRQTMGACVVASGALLWNALPEL